MKEVPTLSHLVAVNNPVGFVADFTSTLEVMVDDIENGTNITCQITGDQEHILIYKESRSIAMLMENGNNYQVLN